MEGQGGLRAEPGLAWLEADDEGEEGSSSEEEEVAEGRTPLVGGGEGAGGRQRRLAGQAEAAGGEGEQRGAQRRAAAEDGSAGEGAGRAPAKRRRKKKAVHWPFICEILQWAHSIMMLKWAFISITVDGPYASAIGLVGCACFGTLVLDWFKADNGHGVGTLTNSYTTLRLSIGLTNICTFVGEAVQLQVLAHPVFAAALSALIITTIVVATSSASPGAHYAAVILWELVVLPAAAVVEASQGLGPLYVDVLLEHRLWGYGLVTAILLHPLDPMTFKWRTADLRMNNKLRVPWDPVVY